MKTETNRGIRHRLLILSIFSMLGVSVLNPSGASALDGFSIFGSDAEGIDLSKFPSINWQNPWTAGSACESTNPDSSLSCNANSFPVLLFNENGEDDARWGYDGKGVIFATEEQRVNNDPQLRTAKAGDTLSFSVKLEDTNRYYDNAETNPILFYSVFVGLSQGLTLKDMHVKVNGQTLSESDYTIEASTDASAAAAAETSLIFGEGASGYIIDIDWADYTHSTSSGNSGYSFESFKYPEQAAIEVLYTAIVDDASANTVFSRTLYQVKYLQNSQHLYTAEPHGIYNGEDYRATALLNGSLIIRSEDEQGAPIAGSKYIVEGVNADSNPSYTGGYAYNPNGVYGEFETNSNGLAIIENIPFGEYEVTAMGGSGNTQVVTVDSATMRSVNPGMKDYYANTLFTTNYLITEEVKDGAGYKYQALPSTTLQYNPETGAYEGDSSVSSYGARIVKEGNNYIFWYPTYGGSKRIVIPSNGKKTASEIFRSKELFSTVGSDVNATIDNFTTIEPTIERGNEGKPVLGPDFADYYDSDRGIYNIGQVRLSVEGEEIQLVAGDAYGLRFSYDEERQGYYLDSDYAYFDIEEIDENTIKITENLILTYSEPFDAYFAANLLAGGMPWQSIITTKDKTVYAASVSFLISGKGYDGPEAIPNPQTSDTLAKAACTILAATTSAYVIGRKLSRR